MRERIPLTEEMIVELLQHRGEGKGLRSLGRHFGVSHMVGSTVSLARGNASLVEMQGDGRWKDSRLPSH